MTNGNGGWQSPNAWARAINTGGWKFITLAIIGLVVLPIMLVPDALERFAGFIELVIQLGENNGNPIALIYLMLAGMFVLGLKMNSKLNSVITRMERHETHCESRHKQIEARFAEIEGGK